MASASSLTHADRNSTSSTDSNQTWMLPSTFETSFPFQHYPWCSSLGGGGWAGGTQGYEFKLDARKDLPV